MLPSAHLIVIALQGICLLGYAWCLDTVEVLNCVADCQKSIEVEQLKKRPCSLENVSKCLKTKCSQTSKYVFRLEELSISLCKNQTAAIKTLPCRARATEIADDSCHRSLISDTMLEYCSMKQSYRDCVIAKIQTECVAELVENGTEIHKLYDAYEANEYAYRADISGKSVSGDEDGICRDVMIRDLPHPDNNVGTQSTVDPIVGLSNDTYNSTADGETPDPNGDDDLDETTGSSSSRNCALQTLHLLLTILVLYFIIF